MNVGWSPGPDSNFPSVMVSQLKTNPKMSLKNINSPDPTPTSPPLLQALYFLKGILLFSWWNLPTAIWTSTVKYWLVRTSIPYGYCYHSHAWELKPNEDCIYDDNPHRTQMPIWTLQADYYIIPPYISNLSERIKISTCSLIKCNRTAF